MRNTFLILIIASALLVSFVESKKKFGRLDSGEIPKMRVMIQNDSQYAPTYYTVYEPDCFSSCQAKNGNSVVYAREELYVCCQLGFSDMGNNWFYMNCLPLSLDCAGHW